MTKHLVQKCTLVSLGTLLSVIASQTVPANAATISGNQSTSTTLLTTGEETTTDTSPVTSLVVAISPSGTTSSGSYTSSASTSTGSGQASTTSNAWELTSSQTATGQTTVGTSTTAVPEPAEIGGGVLSLVFLWLIQRRFAAHRRQVERSQPDVENALTKA